MEFTNWWACQEDKNLLGTNEILDIKFLLLGAIYFIHTV